MGLYGVMRSGYLLIRWHVAALFVLRVFQPHRRQSYRPFWRMVALFLP